METKNNQILKDMFIIILIISFSFIFVLNDSDKIFNPQMMFILLALVTIVIYKVILVSNKKNKLETIEKFSNNDLAAQINSFIDRQGSDGVAQQIPSMSTDDQRQYLQSIQNLSNQVTSLNQRLNDVNQNSGSIVSGNEAGTTNDRLSLETVQKMQNFQIDYLQKQIEKSKELLQQQEIEDSIKKYKPIKVYSSCAVSSADGAFSDDSSRNNIQQSNTNMTNDQIQAMNNMYRTIGQSSSSDGGENRNILGQKISSFLNSLNGPTAIEIN